MVEKLAVKKPLLGNIYQWLGGFATAFLGGANRTCRAWQRICLLVTQAAATLCYTSLDFLMCLLFQSRHLANTMKSRHPQSPCHVTTANTATVDCYGQNKIKNLNLFWDQLCLYFLQNQIISSTNFHPIKYLKDIFAHFGYPNVQKQILALHHHLCISCVSSDLGLVLVLDTFRIFLIHVYVHINIV